MSNYVNPENVNAIREAFDNLEVTGNFLPSVYVIEPTSKCNLKCVMCPNKEIQYNNLGNMSLSLFEKIVQDISPYAEFVMLYWLGEPLLHPNITKMLSVARENIKGRIVISTNLTQVTDEILISMLENTDIILCSLDRWKPKDYEKIRIGASFPNVVSNIERLIELKTENHQAEIVVKGLDIALDSTEYQEFKEYWTRKNVRPLLAWLNDWAGTFPSLRNVASLPIPLSGEHRTACADLWFKMIINWRGEIQMCCFDWRYEHLIASCNDPDWLFSSWHNETIVNMREAHKKGNFGDNKLCKTCNTWGEISEHTAYVDFDEQSYFIVF